MVGQLYTVVIQMYMIYLSGTWPFTIKRNTTHQEMEAIQFL